MTSKELVLNALYNKATPRVPWVPFVGCHGAKLIGVSAEEYFKNADFMVAGAKKAIELYRPDGLPAFFDLQIEAEVMGCTVRYDPGNPPAVMTHPMEEGVALADIPMPTKEMGRFPIVLDAIRKIKAEIGDSIALYGLITGPFTLALHLMGTDIFYNMTDDPDAVQTLMAFCEKVCIQTASWYREAGCDIIAVVDPMVSQISPASFREFVKPTCKRLFSAIKATGSGASYFVCGNAKRNIEDMAQTGCDNISFDENIPMSYVKEIASKYGVSVGGNLHLTVALLFGTPMDNIQDARNCISAGGTSGFILSPGCDLPFATPIENLQAVTAVVYGEDGEFIGHSGGLDGIEVTIPDYANEAQVIVDVITLDSESCAPCQYMMEAVNAAAKDLPLTVVEHKVKQKEAVVFMVKSGVSNIPTILIDGVTKFISIIPAVDVLRASLLEAIAAKG